VLSTVHEDFTTIKQWLQPGQEHNVSVDITVPKGTPDHVESQRQIAGNFEHPITGIIQI